MKKTLAAILLVFGVLTLFLSSSVIFDYIIERAKAAGVFGYLVKPFKPGDLPPAIEVARSRFEQNLALSKEVGSLQEKLEARKLLDRAKGILMTEHGVDEAEAYRRIQVQSMNLRKSMREVAEAIILAKSV